MSLSVAQPDPGPMARLEEVRADANAPTVIFQRLCDGERLQAIAKSWGLPKGQFVLWFITEHRQLFDDAERVRAQDLKHEALEVSDTTQIGVKKKIKPDGSAEITEADMIEHRRLQVETRLKLIEKLDRERFGRFTKHEHTHTLDLGERLRRAREREVIEQAPQVLPAPPSDVPATEPAPAPAQTADADLI